jgi:hypothetical protein
VIDSIYEYEGLFERVERIVEEAVGESLSHAFIYPILQHCCRQKVMKVRSISGD